MFFSKPNRGLNSYVYRPTYLPEGFNEKLTRKFGNNIIIIYSNNDDVEICFTQRPASTVTTGIDNEYTTYTEVEVAGNIAYLFEANAENNSNVLIWTSNGKVFELVSRIEIEQLLLIAESIKKF